MHGLWAMAHASVAHQTVWPASTASGGAHAAHGPSARTRRGSVTAAVLQGGYETTASALGFTIYNLAANPDKAAKLMQVHPSPANSLLMTAHHHSATPELLLECRLLGMAIWGVLLTMPTAHDSTPVVPSPRTPHCRQHRVAVVSSAAHDMQEVDAFGRDREPGRLDIEQLPYVQACFKVGISGALAVGSSVQAACSCLFSTCTQKQCLQSQRLSSC